MPTNPGEIARYIHLTASELVTLSRRHELSSVAHCLELAATAAVEVTLKSTRRTARRKPHLKLVSSR